MTSIYKSKKIEIIFRLKLSLIMLIIIIIMISKSFLQPNRNIGFVGHVAHGKSTLCEALTGIKQNKHSAENERGITIKIGYTNCKIYKCDSCHDPESYMSTGLELDIKQCNRCGSVVQLVSHVSFVDCPGHESLMCTMLSGANVIECAILLIDASQKCPQPQTIEHLAALEIMGVKKIIIVQNKLDLISGIKAAQHYADIKEFVKGSCAENSPIIPISAQKKINVDILCEYIAKYFNDEINTENINDRPKMNIIRSFDVNRPGTEVKDIVGGVIGGTILSGELNVGDKIEIRPGLVTKTNNKFNCTPIITTITSMKTDNTALNNAKIGGLVGVCTSIDSVLTQSDRMVGQVVGLEGNMPDIYTEINAKCIFMKRAECIGTKNSVKLASGNSVLLNIASKSVHAIIKTINKSGYVFELKYPCCMDIGENFAISVRVENSWRLMGMGTLLDPTPNFTNKKMKKKM